MCNQQAKARNSVELQERLFRLAERDRGLTLAILSDDTRIPLATLRGWKNGTTMPAWAIGALGEAGVPDYLLSLVLNPFKRHVGTDQDGDGTLHEAAFEANGFSQEYLSATSPDSEGGAAITPREAAKLGERAMRAGSKLRAVAA